MFVYNFYNLTFRFPIAEADLLLLRRPFKLRRIVWIEFRKTNGSRTTTRTTSARTTSTTTPPSRFRSGSPSVSSLPTSLAGLSFFRFFVFLFKSVILQMDLQKNIARVVRERISKIANIRATLHLFF
jgi:hypothetical protein